MLLTLELATIGFVSGLDDDDYSFVEHLKDPADNDEILFFLNEEIIQNETADISEISKEYQ